ncbi:MAG: ATP-binding cassette domain-containing protein [Bacteroidota bacterium]
MRSFEARKLNLSVVRGGSERCILKDVSFCMQSGKITAVWGPNGSGKTSLLEVLFSGSEGFQNGNGHETFEVSGEIFLDGKRIDGIPGYKRAKWMAKVSQDVMDLYSPSLTLRENLATLFLNAGHHKKGLFQRAVRNPSFKEALNGALDHSVFPLEKRLDEFASDFSGGEAESFSILAATLNNPKVLMLDEHTKKLDLARKAFIERLTVEYIKRKEIFGLWVTHDPLQITRFADGVIWLKEGRIVERTNLERPIDEGALLNRLIQFQE